MISCKFNQEWQECIHQRCILNLELGVINFINPPWNQSIETIEKWPKYAEIVWFDRQWSGLNYGRIEIWQDSREWLQCLNERGKPDDPFCHTKVSEYPSAGMQVGRASYRAAQAAKLAAPQAHHHGSYGWSPDAIGLASDREFCRNFMWVCLTGHPQQPMVGHHVP